MLNTEINKLTLELLDLREHKEKEPFTKEERQVIKQLADLCRQTKLYESLSKNFKREREKFKNATATELYLEMIYKIANAPLVIYATSTVIAYAPMIDDLLGD